MPTASLLCCVHVGESANEVTLLVTANSTSGYSFLLGIGVGAEYPCGSVAASEQSEEEGIAKNAQHRWFALATSTKQVPSPRWWYLRHFLDTMIDFGFVISSFVPVVLFWMWALTSLPFGNLIAQLTLHRFGNDHLRAVWRLSLGLGVIPALAVLIWRLKMQNPSHYRKNSMRDTQIPYWLVIRRYWVSLLAISLTWFIYDFITCVCLHIYIVERHTEIANSTIPGIL